ncbi:MAG: hypothetical protein AAB783_01680 [Patescibacteria group bacterium]
MNAERNAKDASISERMRAGKGSGILRHSKHVLHHLSKPTALILCRDGTITEDIVHFHRQFQAPGTPLQMYGIFGGISALAPNSPVCHYPPYAEGLFEELVMGCKRQGIEMIFCYDHCPCLMFQAAGIKEGSRRACELHTAGVEEVHRRTEGMTVISMQHFYDPRHTSGYSFEFLREKSLILPRDD